MPTCENCKKEWSWKQTIKTLGRLKCPYCREKQYESASSKRRGGMFALIPILLIPINAGFDFSIGTVLMLSLIIVLIVIGTYPFLLKLSNEEEALW